MGSNKETEHLKLTDHISEFRKRLTWTVVFFMIGGSAGYIARQPLIKILKKPLGETLYYTTPAGSFNFVMKIAVVCGLCFALPVITYNIVKFLQPAVKEHVSNKSVRIITLLSLILALSGAIFAFFWVVPMSLHFFKGFKDGNLSPLISANDYLSFIINCILSFMVIFQLPLVILFIDRIKPLPPKRLLKYERYVIVGSLGLALVLPFTYDPLSQFLVALPIIVLYNLSVILVLIVHKRKNITAKVAVVPHVSVSHTNEPRSVSVPQIATTVMAARQSYVKTVTKVNRVKSLDGFSIPQRRADVKIKSFAAPAVELHNPPSQYSRPPVPKRNNQQPRLVFDIM